MDMIVKKNNSRELMLTAEESRIELAVCRFSRYLERVAYGTTLEGNATTLWGEEEGKSRGVVRITHLADGEAKRLRDNVMRVENFTGFGTLLLYLMHIRDKLMKGAHASQSL